jgi:hypothetical protein
MKILLIFFVLLAASHDSWIRGLERPFLSFKGTRGLPGNRLDSNRAGMIMVVFM